MKWQNIMSYFKKAGNLWRMSICKSSCSFLLLPLDDRNDFSYNDSLLKTLSNPVRFDCLYWLYCDSNISFYISIVVHNFWIFSSAVTLLIIYITAFFISDYKAHLFGFNICFVLVTSFTHVSSALYFMYLYFILLKTTRTAKKCN